MQTYFGSGTLWGTRTDIANATPIKFGALQEVNLEFSANTKELYGGSQFPIAVARGTGKITGKAKAAIQGAVFADLFFGVTRATGYTQVAITEAGAVPASTPWQITVANSANFVADLEVTYAATGLPLTKVASAPAAGQYSVTAGVYTFNTADAGKAVLISYSYTTAAAGQTINITNQALGVQPVFAVTLSMQYTAPGGQVKGFLKLPACVASKLTIPTKLEDFTISEFDFSAFADASGNVMQFSSSENS